MGDAPPRTGRGRVFRSAVLLIALGVANGCSGSGRRQAAQGTTVPSQSVAGTTTIDNSSTTTVPAGAVAGLDDYDGDGALDPTCGTQDFGANLVLRIPCAINTASEPPTGTTLVTGSLFRLPSSTDINLDGISGSLLLARDVAGAKVVIFVFNSDALFDTGSATIASADTLNGIIRVINDRYPHSAIQVRGHTDSTGPAAANQSLSERRAANARDYLSGHNLDAAEITSVGLGSTVALTEEKKPDGSDSPEGRAFNRRVEVVVRIR
ncbi:MAG: OmpA-OmpF porin, family [Acidimicrobiaceae bacterium]|nr:OmpA-OmpF porin, family [Acidimicrobiaceae bacterium]